MQGVLIRVGLQGDVPALLQVESRAATMLLQHGGHDLLAMHALTCEDLVRGLDSGIVQVAEMEGTVVGFALAGRIDGHAHLLEIDVDPAYGRRGIGSALLESVCEAAALRGHGCITLVTLREVPWNAPFYARRGFVELGREAQGSELMALIERERMLGIAPLSRVVMRRRLSLSPGRTGRNAG